MKYKFLKLFFLFSIIFIAKIKSDDGVLCNSTLLNKIPGAHFYLTKGNNRSHYIYFLGLNGTLQMYRAQSQRSCNFLKSVVLNINGTDAGFKALTITFCRTSAEHLSSCKLIIFPFHVFW